MPFTFAHPAIVMPINKVFRTRLSLSGLVIGSMVPDFEKFILVTDVKTYSHTWHGMFWLDLPLGFAIAFLFHTVVRDTLIDNLPAFFRRRLIGYKKLNWYQYCKEHFWNVLLAMFIGIFSHIVWDDFTHADGFFVSHISFLQGYGPYAGYKILQFTTSIIGVLAVLAGISTMPQQHVAPKKLNTGYWLIILCTAIAFTSFRFLIDLDITELSLLVITVLSGLLLGTILAPVIMKMAYRIMIK
jgi:hypothetical protein